MKRGIFLFIFYTALAIIGCHGFRSRWTFQLNQQDYGKPYQFSNYLYANSKAKLHVLCNNQEYSSRDGRIQIKWIIKEVDCMEDISNTTVDMEEFSLLHEAAIKFWATHNFTKLNAGSPPPDPENYVVRVFQTSHDEHLAYPCEHQNIVTPMDEGDRPYMIAYVPQNKERRHDVVIVQKEKGPDIESAYTDDKANRITRAWADGMYQLVLVVTNTNMSNILTTSMIVDLHGRSGFLSAMDWPLLPYNAVMAFLSLLIATIWMIVWGKSQRHTHQIHVVIGSVAVVAGVCDVIQYIQLSLVNSNGVGVPGLKWIAILTNVIQIAIFSQLLMTISLGYGLSRFSISSRLSAAMITLVTIQLVSELAWQVVNDAELEIQYKLPSLAKAILWFQATISVIIAGWVVIASIRTMTELYRGQHTGKTRVFTVFVVSCVIIFIAQIVVFGLSMGWMQACRKHWQWNSVIAGFSSMKNFILLCLLMWLWRPQDISQTYAFVPLALNDSDNDDDAKHSEGDDDDDDDDEVTEFTAINPDVNENEAQHEKLMQKTL